jgi:hypothetical protein
MSLSHLRVLLLTIVMWASFGNAYPSASATSTSAAITSATSPSASLLPAFMLPPTQSITQLTAETMASLDNALDRNLVRPKPPGTHEQRDWAAPYNKSVMDTAIRSWLLRPAQAAQSHTVMEAHCKSHDVPFGTFKPRLAQVDPFQVPKRGPKYLGNLTPADHKNITASFAARDHFNMARSPAANIDALNETVFPKFTRQQVANTYHHTIKRAAPYLGTQATQASTKDRSGAITAANQRHHHHTVTTAWEFAEKNSPPELQPDGTLLRRSDLAEDFTCNLDEANAIANLAPGRVVVDKTKTGKHNQNTDSSRVSITSVHLGFASGAIGGSMYLMTGVNPPPHTENTFQSSEWLHQTGAPKGSFVQMTETAYMTNETWDKVAPRLASNIRDMPVVKDHPNWWVVLHLDGFKSHVMTKEVT